MNKKIVLLFVTVALLGGGWGGYTLGVKQNSFEVKNSNLNEMKPGINEGQVPHTSSNPVKKVDENTPITIIAGEKDNKYSHFLKDKDALIEAFKSVHDTYVVVEYTAEQLKGFQEDNQNKNYKNVLENFVEERLDKEIETFQTISPTVNPRIILVATNDQTYYEFTMQQWHNYDGIWTVTQYKDFYLNGNVDYSNQYRIIMVEEAPEKVTEWANLILQAPEWKKEYMMLGDKTYALIKTSSRETDSVELEDILVNTGDVVIYYQTFDYHQVENKSILNDYLLIELAYGEVFNIDFINTYSTEQ